MKQAVIATGGKQYLVAEGQKIGIEKIEGKAGDKTVFDQVLCIVEGDKTKLGKPTVKGVTVEGKITDQTRTDKIEVIKFKSKKRYYRRGSHRQEQTVVLIEKIA